MKNKQYYISVLKKLSPISVNTYTVNDRDKMRVVSIGFPYLSFCVSINLGKSGMYSDKVSHQTLDPGITFISPLGDMTLKRKKISNFDLSEPRISKPATSFSIDFKKPKLLERAKAPFKQDPGPQTYNLGNKN